MDNLVKNPTTDASLLEASLWEAFDAGDIALALRHAKQLSGDYPQYASGWYSVSQLAYQLKNFKLATQAIENALKLVPHSSVYQLQLANLQGASGAIASLRNTLEHLDLTTLVTRYQLETAARLMVVIDDHRRALMLYEQVIDRGEADAQSYFNVATVCRFLGLLDRASEMLSRCLREDPKHTAARLLDAGLRKKTADDNQVAALTALTGDYEVTPRARVEAGFALAKELEDLGDYKASFSYLSLAATLRRQHINYNLSNDLATIAELASTPVQVPKAMQEERWNGEGAIFVLGLPRSGTTLVDRILSMHSDVESIGEPNALPMSLNRLLAEQHAGRKIDRCRAVQLASELPGNAVASRYLSMIQPLLKGQKCFIDKLPLNYLNVGLIASAMPSAKIVLLERAPLDVIYAIYKTLFEDVYPFSYDLVELTRYYIAYRALVAHWLKEMPERIHRVSYESLVSNPTSTIEPLTAFCGLEFEAAMVHPEHNQAASTTASATQVRQPIHRGSIERWRCYEEELAPVIQMLRHEGIDPYHY